MQYILRNKRSDLRLKEQELLQTVPGQNFEQQSRNQEWEIQRGTATQINHTKLKLLFM